MVRAGNSGSLRAGSGRQVLQFVHYFGREAAVAAEIRSKPAADILVGGAVIAFMKARAIRIVAGVLFPFQVTAGRYLRSGLGPAVAVHNFNGQFNTLGYFLTMFLNGVADFLPFRIIVFA